MLAGPFKQTAKGEDRGGGRNPRSIIIVSPVLMLNVVYPLTYLIYFLSDLTQGILKGEVSLYCDLLFDCFG